MKLQPTNKNMIKIDNIYKFNEKEFVRVYTII